MPDPRLGSSRSSVWSRPVAVLLFVVLFGLCSSSARAARSPGWLNDILKEASSPVESDDRGEMLFYEENFSLPSYADHVTVRVRWVVRVLVEGGVAGLTSPTVIRFRESDWMVTANGWSVSPEGDVSHVSRTDMRPMTFARNSESYTDARGLEFDLPGSRVGTVIACEYKLRRRTPMPGAIVYLSRTIPVHKWRVSVRPRRGWDFLYHIKAPGDPTVNISGSREYIIEGSYVPPMLETKLSPPPADVSARIMFLFGPKSAKTGRDGLVKTWTDLADWYEGQSAPACVPSEKTEGHAFDLVADETNDAIERIRPIYDFMRKEIRYVAIEFGIGGYRPREADMVLSTRFGDCKDKAALMKTLLESAGIPSNIALLGTRGSVTPDPEFPSPFRFNHAVVAIPYELAGKKRDDGEMERHAEREHDDDEAEKDDRLPFPVLDPPDGSTTLKSPGGTSYLLLDPTSRAAPFPVLPYWDQGTYILLVDARDGGLIPVGQDSASGNHRERTAEVWVDESGLQSVRLTQWDSGQTALGPASSWLENSEKQDNREPALRLARLVSPTAETRFARVTYHDRWMRTLERRVEYSIPGVTGWENGTFRPALPPAEIPSFPYREERSVPILLPYAYRTTENVQVHFPESVKIEQAPAPAKLESDFGSFFQSVQISGSSARIKRRFELSRTLIAPDDLKSFQAFLRDAARLESEAFLLSAKDTPENQPE